MMIRPTNLNSHRRATRRLNHAHNQQPHTLRAITINQPTSFTSSRTLTQRNHTRLIMTTRRIISHTLSQRTLPMKRRISHSRISIFNRFQMLRPSIPQFNHQRQSIRLTTHPIRMTSRPNKHRIQSRSHLITSSRTPSIIMLTSHINGHNRLNLIILKPSIRPNTHNRIRTINLHRTQRHQLLNKNMNPSTSTPQYRRPRIHLSLNLTQVANLRQTLITLRSTMNRTTSQTTPIKSNRQTVHRVPTNRINNRRRTHSHNHYRPITSKQKANQNNRTN